MCDSSEYANPLQWRHNDQDSVSNHQPHGCLLNRSYRRIKENIKAPRHWPLCGEFTGTGEFPAQRASYAENVSIWWRHHGYWIIHIDGLQLHLDDRVSYVFLWQINQDYLCGGNVLLGRWKMMQQFCASVILQLILWNDDFNVSC